jgi:hypothetical protein
VRAGPPAIVHGVAAAEQTTIGGAVTSDAQRRDNVLFIGFPPPSDWR